jgi:hypothetical protein
MRVAIFPGSISAHGQLLAASFRTIAVSRHQDCLDGISAFGFLRQEPTLAGSSHGRRPRLKATFDHGHPRSQNLAVQTA